MLTRAQATLLMQVHTGHILLNSFLFKIGKSEMKACQKCQVRAEEEALAEIVTHFLFWCNTFIAQRCKLARAIGRENVKYVLIC